MVVIVDEVVFFYYYYRAEMRFTLFPDVLQTGPQMDGQTDRWLNGPTDGPIKPFRELLMRN